MFKLPHNINRYLETNIRNVKALGVLLFISLYPSTTGTHKTLGAYHKKLRPRHTGTLCAADNILKYKSDVVNYK